MKKLLFICGIAILHCLPALAQDFNRYPPIPRVRLTKFDVVDSAYLKCSYKLTYLKYPLKPEKISEDTQILLIGKTTSKYYSLYKAEYNDFVEELLDKGREAVPNIKNKGAWNFELFKNYPAGKETVTDIMSMLRGSFMYEETLPVFDWQITEDTQKVLSYTCQKATVNFRGREWTAWFTIEIPMPNGPWKFGGLPGLILKLSDAENHFVYECDGLEQLKIKEPIKFYKVDSQKLSRKDLDKLYQRFHDDMRAYLESAGQEFATKNVPSKNKIPYNPIELEWYGRQSKLLPLLTSRINNQTFAPDIKISRDIKPHEKISAYLACILTMRLPIIQKQGILEGVGHKENLKNSILHLYWQSSPTDIDSRIIDKIISLSLPLYKTDVSLTFVTHKIIKHQHIDIKLIK